MNVAELSESKEEDFSAVIMLMERLARVETSDAGNALSRMRALGFQFDPRENEFDLVPWVALGWVPSNPVW